MYWCGSIISFSNWGLISLIFSIKISEHLESLALLMCSSEVDFKNGLEEKLEEDTNIFWSIINVSFPISKIEEDWKSDCSEEWLVCSSILMDLSSICPSS